MIFQSKILIKLNCIYHIYDFQIPKSEPNSSEFAPEEAAIFKSLSDVSQYRGTID